MVPVSWAVFVLHVRKLFHLLGAPCTRGRDDNTQGRNGSCFVIWVSGLQSHFNLWKVRSPVVRHFWDTNLTENLFQSVFDFKITSALCHTDPCQNELCGWSLPALGDSCSLQGSRPSPLLKTLYLGVGELLPSYQSYQQLDFSLFLCSVWNDL